MAVPQTTEGREVLHAVIDHAAADNTIVAATAGKKILVLSYTIVASGGANTYRFESGTGGTALTGQASLAATTGSIVVNYNPGGVFAPCATNTLLNLELSAATSVDGHLSYVLID